MSKTRLLLVFGLSIGLSAAAPAKEPAKGPAKQPKGAAEAASLDVLIDAIRSNRKALVAVNLHLTDDEAAKFWPIYERYQKEMNAVGDRQVAMIKDYTANFSDLADDKAKQLVEDYLGIEADRVKVRSTYVAEFAAAIPGRKLARFYQIENKMDAVIRYDLAAAIPVVEEGAGGAAH